MEAFTDEMHSWPGGWRPIPYAERCRARKAELSARLDAFVTAAKHRRDIAAIVVFGSFARDEISPWSDIDVLVARDAPDDARSIDLIADLDREGTLAGDLIGVPSSKYPAGLEATPIGRTILAEGRVVYARPT